MTITLDEFWNTIEKLELVDKKTIDAVSSSIANKQSKGSPFDAVSVAKYLIKKGHITRYQAKHVLASRGERLRRGSYLLLSDEAEGALSQWILAFDTKAKRKGLWLQMPIDQISPGLLDSEITNRFAQVDSLQDFEINIQGDSCELFWRLPSGKLLSEHLRQGEIFDTDQVFRIGSSLLDALEVLQSLKLRVYAFDADHVWITEEGAALLLINPVSAKEEVRETPISDAISYVAPEVGLDLRHESDRSDVFSLGCLLFRIVTGRDPYPEEDRDESSWQRSAPNEVAIAIKDQSNGLLLFRLLAYAIAQHPDSRFANAGDFKTAWEVGRKASLDAVLRVQQKEDGSAESAIVNKKNSINAVEPERKASSNKETKSVGFEKPVLNQGINVSPPLVKDQAHASHGHPLNHSDVEVVEGAELVNTDSISNEKRKQSTSTSGEDLGSSTDESKLEQKRSGFDVPQSEKIASLLESEDEAVNKRLAHSQEMESFDRTDAQSDTLKQSKRKARSELISDQVALEKNTHVGGDSLGTGSIESGKGSTLIEESPKRLSHRRKKKKSKAPLVLGGMSVAVIVLLIGLIAGGSDEEESKEEPRVRRPPPLVIPPVTGKDRDEERNTETAVASVAGYNVVDDEQLLFVPPYGTDSQTLPLELLPPGPAVIISCRISDFMKHEMAQSLLTGVKTGLEDMLTLASDRVHFPLEKINRLTITMFPGDAGWPEVALAVELLEPTNATDLMNLLTVDQARTRENKVIYVGDEEGADAYYWTVEEGSEAVIAFAIGSIERISEVADLEGSAIPLPRTSQSLWSATSIDTDLVVLFTPNFLFADGRELLSMSAPEFIDPLKQFMQPDINAALVAMQLNTDQSVFIETRFAPSGGISEAALLRKVAEAFGALPAWANDFILDSVQDPSWKLLAIRMPQMMQYLSEKIRFGLSENSVVANTYLPQSAFPQLAFAGLLAMNTSTSGAPLLSTEAVKLLSVDEMLDREMTVSFDQESLEFALEAIVNAFQEGLPAGSEMPKAVIVGGDLELMGITQNQQVRDFSKDQKPLRQVLTDLVLQANPDKSATGPSDLKQSLIWVVTNGEQGKKEIRITTRQAAEREGYQVPKEFTSQN